MTTIATRAAAIGQDFTGSDIIQTAGYAAKGDGGEGTYYLIDPATYSGAPADAGPGTIECTNGAHRVGARSETRFGVGSKIRISDKRMTFGNGISPFGFDLVALAVNDFAAGQGVIEVTANRASLDGFTLIIPASVYDAASDTGPRVSGVRTKGASNAIYHNRVWNVEIVGGYKSFDLAGLEGDIRKTRAKGPYAYGYHVTGSDNEFSPSCTAADGDIGFYSSAGAEGAMHCVRNRINFHFEGGLPNRMFCFDDTPLETGIWCDNVRGGHFLTYHGKVGQHADAAESAHYIRLQRSRNCTFENVATYRKTDAATLAVSAPAYFLDVPFSWNGDTRSSVRNRFVGYQLKDVELAKDAGALERAAHNTFIGCEGTQVSRLTGDNHQLTGKGEALAAGGTASFTRYLNRRPGGDYPHVLRVLGRAIVSRSEAEDVLLDLSLRVPILDAASTVFAGTAQVTEREKTGSGNYAVSIGNVSYDVADNFIRFDLTGPANFATKCEVVLTDVLCDNGGF